MIMRLELFGLALALLGGTAAAEAPQSAWDALLRHDPVIATARGITPLEKEILRSLTPEQATRLARGADPSTIILNDGRALEELLNAAGLDLSWYTLDAGGGTSAGGAYRLHGTLGQADAGVLTGGAFILTGGLQVVPDASGGIFRDGFESGDVNAWSSAVGGPN